MRLWIVGFVLVVSAAAFVACAPDRVLPPYDVASGSDASVDAGGLRVDALNVVTGVNDGERDPSVVAIDGAGVACSGVLVAGDAVLTSSMCVGPPGFSADQIAVRPDPSAPPMAHGERIVLSPTIESVGASAAVILLNRQIVDALPTWIRTAPAIAGEHLRTVGFEPNGEGPSKILRDHLPVVSGRLEEFLVAEASCGKQAGAPAFDESTEEVVGLVMNAAPCRDVYSGTTYARALPLRDFVEAALALPFDDDAGWGDAGRRAHGSKGRAATDFRADCDGGLDCSTGVCVDADGDRSCSRTCGSGDRCPTGSHCLKAANGDAGMLSVCADAP